MAQQAATHCVFLFLNHVVSGDYEDLVNYLCPKTIALYLKSRCEYCDFTKTLSILLESCGIKYFVGCLTEIFKKLEKIVDDGSTQTHLNKVEACTLLELLALRLQGVADLVIGFFSRDVMTCLNKACSDRVLKVQQAAQKARKAWEMLEDIHQEIEVSKETQDAKLDGMTPDELIKVKTGFGDVEDSKTLGYLKDKNMRRSPY